MNLEENQDTRIHNHKLTVRNVAVYRFYKKSSKKDKRQSMAVSLKDFARIRRLLGEGILRLLIDEERSLKLPYFMGEIRVTRKNTLFQYRKIVDNKTKAYLTPDWGETRKLWRENPEAKAKKTVVYLENEHTSGFRFGLYWRKSRAKAAKRYHNLMALTTREFDRKLAKRLKTVPMGKIGYMQHPHYTPDGNQIKKDNNYNKKRIKDV